MIYKRYNNEYGRQVIALLNLCFPDKKITKQSFSWKHFHDYFDNKTVAYLAFDEQKLCSFVCFLPFSVQKQNKKNIFYACSVVATHPDYRRLGLITKLTQIAEKDFVNHAGCFGFSNSSGVKIDKYSKKINYQIIGRLAKKLNFSFPYLTNYNLEAVKSIPGDFWLQYSSKFFELKKNKKYFVWRYVNNPKKSFRILKIKQQNKILGYALVEIGKFKVHICDLFILNNNNDKQKNIIKCLARYAWHKHKVGVSYIFLPNKFWQQSSLFFSLTKKIPMYFTVQTKSKLFLKADNWRITGSDIL